MLTVLFYPESFLSPKTLLPETPPFSTLLFFSLSVLFSFCSFVLLSLPPFQIHNWYTTITPAAGFAHTHV